MTVTVTTGMLPGVRSSFRVKLALLTATFAALPLVTVGWLLVDVNEREAESASQALQIALTERVAQTLEDELGGARRALEAISSALSDDRLPEDARVALALRLLDAEATLELAAVYDADGSLIDRMRAPDARGTTPETISAALRDAAEGQGMGIAAPVEDEGVRALLVVPIRARGRITGYVAAPHSLASAQLLVERLSRAQLASNEGLLMVVDAERRALAHPSARPLTPLADAARGIDLAGLPDAPISAEVLRDGRRWVTTLAPVRGVPWVVVAQIPRDVVYAAIDEMQRIVVSTIAIALLAALAAALIVARRMSAPIAKLVAFTKDLAARRFDRRVVVDTGDELSVLGGALSDAAAALEASEARVREEEAIRADLGRYLSAELVEQVIRREQSMELGGQRRAITVLFADVVAFTPLSERLPPEQTVALLNELFTLLTEAVFRHGGTVDKFVGDCVMALFGAPQPHDDHAARALRAAQDMLRFLESANAAWKEEHGVEVQLAIGVNSGEAVVGNVGSETRMEYTAIGDVVNVAARLETIARPLQILVTRATRDASGDAFDAAPVGEREVPGRSAPVELFEVRW